MDAASGEVRKAGILLRLRGQPVQILLELLVHPGEVVTRDQLRAAVWGSETFVDFEHGLNAAINKLRRALGDSADNPKFIETVPGRGYRFLALVSEAYPSQPQPPPAIFPLPPKRTNAIGRGAALALVVACLGLVVWRWSSNRPAGTVEFKLKRITVDDGASRSPALSRDGNLIAYASDRATPGRLDLYVEHTAGGGHPLRLTWDGEGNAAPDFSSDSSKIVFRSARDGGGIYEVATLGGPARLVARDGFDPKYSPDGTEVAYWVGSENIAQAVPGNGTVWVTPVAGGTPRQVGKAFTSARQPIWAPAGHELLVIGYMSKTVHDISALDWWLIPATENQGAPARVRLREVLSRSEVQVRDEAGNLATSIPVPTMPKPRCWLASEGSVVFSFEHGDTSNLWTIRLTAEGMVNGGVLRLTTAPEQESDPSCASNGSVAFVSEEHRSQVWWAPLDGAIEENALERIAPLPGIEEYPSLSADSRKVAFVNNRTGLRSVWLLDVPSGKQTRVSPSPFAQRFPVLSSTGSWVAYSSYERDKRPAYVVPASGGIPQMVCVDCLRITDWTRDEAGILTVQGSPYRISRIDRTTRKQTVLIEHQAFNLMYGRYSPDDRWISFTVRKPQNRSWIAVAQLQSDSMGPVGERAWIKVSEEGPEDRANWSADGTTLYFSSSRDGHLCIWGQRLDPLTRRLVGEPFAVRHLHEGAAMLQLGWSLSGGHLAMTLNESRANIWMLQRTAH